jgi:outer membrane protein
MNNKILKPINILIGVSLFLLIAGGIFLFLSIPKVGFVRNKVIVENYGGIKEAKIIYEKKVGVMQAQVDTVGMYLEKEMNEYEAGKSKLSSKQRLEKENILKEKIADFQKYKNSIEEKSIAEQEKLLQAAYSQINSFTKEYAQENDFDIILGTTDEGNVMYGKDGLDITNAVLEALNKKYKGK